jgi:hypothetical protein
MAGVSLARVFSCASKTDTTRQQSPSIQGTETLSAGVRIPIFSGKQVAGSLQVLAFSEWRSGLTQQADRRANGVVLGVVLHTP